MNNVDNNIVHFKFQMGEFSLKETAVVVKREGEKIYTNNLSGTPGYIFNVVTGYCYNDNTTFGAKRTLIIKD